MPVTSEKTDTLDVLKGFSKLEDIRDCAVHIELWAEALSNPRIKETVVRIDESIRDRNWSRHPPVSGRSEETLYVELLGGVERSADNGGGTQNGVIDAIN